MPGYYEMSETDCWWVSDLRMWSASNNLALSLKSNPWHEISLFKFAVPMKNSDRHRTAQTLDVHRDLSSAEPSSPAVGSGQSTAVTP
ncbi:hypothetical protein RRG08_042472 [Elysia crispata]|uniref:Uncharacterized protein n=1 Tax=Elysia crispata TaxID=231223 RepID=A0AAE1DDG8_9GAST|nr:hypothetical protein RRG08_042472 [Elysia crispata]